MIRHSIKLAFRNFIKYRSSFVINLVGLSTGLACALLIFLWVNDEVQMDKFHEKDHRLYRVLEHQQYVEGIMTTQSTPGLLAETLAEEIPEIEHAATVNWLNNYTISFGDENLKAEGHYVTPDFFQLFSYRLLAGDQNSALRDLRSIVISRELAEVFFGSVEDAMGQTMEIDHEKSFIVNGVLEKLPQNSSFQFDILLPFEDYKLDNEWLLSWGNNSPNTMVTLVESADPEFVETKIAGFIKERNEDSNVTLFLKPFSRHYLHGRYENGIQSGGRIEYVRLFSVIAVFILIIACINFMNLSTARGSRRSKEVGIKKAVGIGKESLIFQFLTESVSIALISLFLAVLMVWLFLPKFNLITGKHISMDPGWQLIVFFLATALVTGFLAGSYPAFYLSSFKPVSTLKGDIKTSLGELWARKGLVIFQFMLSSILIVAVFVVYSQIQFLQYQNLGYNQDQLVYFDANGTIGTSRDAFLEQAGKLPGVSMISTIGHDLVGRNNNTSGLDWEGKNPDDEILFEHVRVNFDLLETIEVVLKEGRSFSRQFGSDTSRIIFNETAIGIMGMDDPIGQHIRLWNEYDMEIVGVVKDFHFQSLHENIKPLFFRLAPEQTWLVMARLEAGREQEGLGNLQSFYEEFNPGFPFEYRFLDQEFAIQYAAEKRVATLSRFFAGLAILISCLGLFGLASFTADIKKKEIGIRKILGANIASIISLLTKDFSRLVLIGIIIGIPLAYLVIDNWLGRFHYRIELSWWFFVLSGALLLVISWLTVSTQAFRSAVVNPSDCLRDE
jgi:putative ABC transport system permease protein